MKKMMSSMKSVYAKALIMGGVLTFAVAGAAYADQDGVRPVLQAERGYVDGGGSSGFIGQAHDSYGSEALKLKHREIDKLLFGENKGYFAEQGITVTNTGPIDGRIEIGITPYDGAKAEYIYGLVGQELVKVVEGFQAVTLALPSNYMDTPVSDDGQVRIMPYPDRPNSSMPTPGEVKPMPAGEPRTLPAAEPGMIILPADLPGSASSRDVLRGPALPADYGYASPELMEKHQEVNKIVFEEHRGTIEGQGFKVTNTGPHDGYIEIGIMPYSEANAQYVYDLVGKEQVRVAEGFQAELFLTADAPHAESDVLAAGADDAGVRTIAYQEAPGATSGISAQVWAAAAALGALLLGWIFYTVRRRQALK